MRLADSQYTSACFTFCVFCVISISGGQHRWEREVGAPFAGTNGGNFPRFVTFKIVRFLALGSYFLKSLSFEKICGVGVTTKIFCFSKTHFLIFSSSSAEKRRRILEALEKWAIFIFNNLIR